ncbi:MAG: ferredoxin family protein, partial [Dehalococcoidia bacterium]|nr:ferredoxin family protein [Dehalococcoidia bacterium]
MTVKTIDANLCDGCGICIESCPTDVLRVGVAVVPTIAYPHDCMSCFLCELDCP